MKRMQILSLVAFSAFALAGCATKSSSGDQSGSGQTSKMRDSAVAVLGPAPNGGNVRGTVTFREGPRQSRWFPNLIVKRMTRPPGCGEA